MKNFVNIFQKSYGSLLSECQIGISIRSDVVRLVALERQASGMVVTHAHALPLSADLVQKNGAAYIAQELKTLIQDSGIKQKRCSLDVSGDDVKTLQTAYSMVPANELRLAIEAHFNETLYGETLDNYYWDYVEIPQGSKAETHVFAIAVRKLYLDRLLEAVEKAGLIPVGVDFSAFAFLNGVQIARDEKKVTSAALIHIDKKEAQISFVHENNISYFRSISFDPARLLSSLRTAAKGAASKPSAAADAKPSESDTSSSGQAASKAQPVNTHVVTTIEELISELVRSVNYVRLHRPLNKIERIIIGGYSNQIDVFKTHIEQALKIDVQVIDAYEHVKIQSDFEESIRQNKTEMAVPVGLASHTPRIKLLPPKYRRMALQPMKAAIKRFAAAGFVIVVLGLVGIAALYNAHLGKQTRMYQIMLSDAERVMARVSSLQAAQTEEAGDIQALREIMGEALPLYSILDDISKTIPDRIMLSSIRYTHESGRIVLTGQNFYESGLAQKKMSEFITLLETSLYFENVRLNFIKKDNDTRTQIREFEIEARPVIGERRVSSEI